MPISTLRRPNRLLAQMLASAASVALIAFGDAAATVALAQNSVGTAAAVNPRSTGGTRTLELGSNIVYRERIQTSDTGSVQVLFVDKTTLNVGPGSNLVIDEFVYDPNAKTGSMAVSLSKGAVRFVGGNASHSGGAEVKTPVASIGIRGGVASILHHRGQTTAILQFGTLTVTAPGGQTEVVRRPGFMVVIGPGGISPPVRVSQSQIDAIIAQTRSRLGQNGGRHEPTPDVTGLDKAASSPCSVPVQGQTTFDLAAFACSFVNRETGQVVDDVAQHASQQAQDAVAIPILPNEGPGDGCPPYCNIGNRD